jgi:hypothetical protein
MSNKRALALLARLEARCWADAKNASLVAAWRHAAARVSGNLSMKAEILGWGKP